METMTKYRTLKEIAVDIRKALKAEFPDCTFSVVGEQYSMGQSLNLSLMKAPFEVFASMTDNNGNTMEKQYAQLNHFTIRQEPDKFDWFCNGAKLTPEAWQVLKRADQIANKENYDRSDIQTDYFDVKFYFHLAIGKWDKPFEVVVK